MLRKIVLISLVLLMVAAGAILVLGVQRYGSVQGLVRRVQIEISSLQPRPTVLPTIVPQATVDLDAVAALLEPTPTVRPTATLPSTNTPDSSGAAPPVATVAPTPTAPLPSATPGYVAAADQVYLDGYQHLWQGWNNCAPATFATYVSFWGVNLGQDAAAARLKPNEFDKNVLPAEIAALARAEGLEAQWLVNGDAALLRLLLSNGIPVMIETWLEPEPDDGMGHYRLVVGYDQPAGEWIVSDSYVSHGVELPYRGIRLTEAEFTETWRVFMNTMIIVYPAEQQALVSKIVGQRSEPAVMWPQALQTVEAQLRQTPEDGVLWHNLGRVLWELGEGEQAVTAFDQARALGLPWRTFWYQFEALAAYQAAGRYEDVLALTQATIDQGGGGEEIYYWKGMAHAGLGQDDAAASAWRYALWWHPDHAPSLAQLNS